MVIFMEREREREEAECTKQKTVTFNVNCDAILHDHQLIAAMSCSVALVTNLRVAKA